MSDRLLSLYHRMPGPARSVVASMRGYYLRSCRYDRHTDRLVDEAFDRECWDDATWARWREARLESLLYRAATAVPYYRDYWTKRRRAGDRASWELLENWPVLEKATLREKARAFVADDVVERRLIHEHTSGTTGTPLDLWFGRATVRAWYALCEARIRRWNYVDRGTRWAMLGGQLVTPVSRTRPPFWVWNAGLKQLYLSSYHLAPANAAAYFAAMRRYRVEYAFGYASSLYALAQTAIDAGLEAPPLAVAISNAEPLFDHQRDAIARAFGCEVRDTYGMCEICCGASECSAGRLHLWPDAGVLEVLDDRTGKSVPAGVVGDLVCTGLLNLDMPLVRYRVGDRGAMAADDSCACGRTLPVIASIDGRADDTLVTRDGRRIGRLDPVFKAGVAIREAQIVQEDYDLIRMKLVPAPGFGERDSRVIAERLRDRVGDVRIVEEIVDQIPRSANGKFRAVICALDARKREPERLH